LPLKKHFNDGPVQAILRWRYWCYQRLNPGHTCFFKIALYTRYFLEICLAGRCQ